MAIESMLKRLVVRGAAFVSERRSQRASHRDMTWITYWDLATSLSGCTA